MAEECEKVGQEKLLSEQQHTTTNSGLNGTTNPTNDIYSMNTTEHDKTWFIDTTNTTVTTKHDNKKNKIDTPIRSEGSLSVPTRWS